MARHDTKLNVLRQQGTLNPHPEAVTDDLFRENDFFDARDIVQVKYEMLRKAQADKVPVSHCAALFGFSRPSFYQAQMAFDQGGLTGLLPQKRGPRRAHKLSGEVMAFVREAQSKEPSLTSQELVGLVQKKFRLQVHPRSIERRLSLKEKKR
jgi:transposase